MTKYFTLIKHYIFHLFSFIIPLFFYILTLSPTVNFGDTGELITAAATLGIPHPPGSPIWVALADIFTYIPVGSIAFRVNLSSAFFVASSSLVLYLLSEIILKHLIENLKIYNPYEYLTKKQQKRQRDLIEKKISSQNEWNNYLVKYHSLISIVITIIYSFTFPIWSHAVYTEVYPLNTLFFVLILYFLFRFYLSENTSFLYFSMFLFGLAITNHYLIFVVAPVILSVMFMRRQQIFKPKNLFILSICFLSGVSFFFFLILRSKANPPIDWGNPENFQNLLGVIQRRQFGSKTIFHANFFNVPVKNFIDIPDFFKRIFQSFSTLIKIATQSYTFPLASVGLLGFYASFKFARKIFVVLLITLVIAGMGFAFLTGVGVSTNDKMTPYLPVVLVFSIFIAYGIVYLLKFARQIVFVLFLIPIYFLFVNYNSVNMSSNTIAYDHGRLMLRQVPKNAIIFTEENNWLFPLAYLQIVEEMRPDVTIYDRNGNIFNDIYAKAKKDYKGEEDFEMKRRQVENDIVTTSKRPVYYAVDKTFENYVDSQISREGIMYRIGPPKKLDFAGFYKDLLNIDIKKRLSYWDAEYMIAYYHLQYAVDLIESNKIDQAVMQLKKAEDWSNNDYRMLNNIGIYYIRLEKQDEAKRVFQKAIDINPDYYIGYTNLGYVYEVAGDKKVAEKYYIKALSINESYLNGIYRLAGFYETEGELEKALYGYRLALKIDPSNEDLVKHINELENMLVSL